MSFPAPVVSSSKISCLRGAPAEGVGDHRLEIGLGIRVLLVDGEIRRQAKRTSARDDRDLVHRIRFGDHPGDEHVADLVIGRDLLLLFRDDQALPLHPHHHLVFCLFEVAHRDGLVVLPGREKCRFVHEVGEIGAGKSGCSLGEGLELHIVGQRDVLRVHAQNAFASLHIRPVDDHLAVESSGTHQRRVKHVGPVRGRDDDHAAVLLEAVHLHEELVERLLPLVVSAAESRAAVAPDGVDLVDEDDARSALLSLLEEVADAARADADEHFDEVGAGDREEGDSRFAGDRAREQRLARAGRPEQQHAARDLAAELLEFRRLLQELDDLHQFHLRLIGSGDIEEGHFRRAFVQHLRPALAEREYAPRARRPASGA